MIKYFFRLKFFSRRGFGVQFWPMYLFHVKYMHQTRIFTAFPWWKTRQCIDILIYIVTSFSSRYFWVIKWNITPVTLISENNKAKILKTLFKVKLLALVEQLVECHKCHKCLKETEVALVKNRFEKLNKFH